MTELFAVKAFIIGILSASSLLFGAVASFFWRPSDRVVAFMLALGGGALLAALTLDLTAEALHRGHHLFLCFGCLVGGLLFIFLDMIVDDYGGFMRKAATTVYHVRKQKHRQYEQILTGIGQTDIFKQLHTRHFKQLSSSIKSQDFKKGDIIYHPGDPSDNLHIAISGEVELFYPEKDLRPSRKVISNQAFGRFAFHIGAPHETGAAVMDNTTVLLVPRNAFNALLLNSATLQQVMHRWLRSQDLFEYLHNDQKMTERDASQWLNNAVQELLKVGQIPAPFAPERKKSHFMAISEQISSVPFFKGLPYDEIDSVSSCLLYKRYEKGQTLFHQDGFSDRMFILDHGEISLIDGKTAVSQTQIITSHDAFGVFPFICGSPHVLSAVATRKSGVWGLRKTEFLQLLRDTQIFRERVKQLLRHDDFGNHLQNGLNFDGDKSSHFIKNSLKAIDQGQPLPSASALLHNPVAHGSAAIAIWLGIMLDGIPESLVIGSSMIHTGASFSLLAGLFIANFPESLSSSIGMRQQGMSATRIIMMWGSIVLITGIGASVGNIFFGEAEPVMFTLVEGVAAGAMLTMIAQTMLPEAYFKGGSIVGFSTLLGFLAAILAKALE